MSTHNPRIAARAVREGVVENMLFSINPAFDLLSTDDLEEYREGDYAAAVRIAARSACRYAREWRRLRYYLESNRLE
jgi:hypothetical protein